MNTSEAAERAGDLAIEERVTELEMRFMQQERIIQDLNDTVYRQEQVIGRIEQAVAMLGEQFRSMLPSSIQEPDNDERPPHY